MAQSYQAATPDLASIACTFRAVSKPVIAATAVDLIRDPNQTLGYIWLEGGAPPLPVLAAFRHPDLQDAMTSVSSADLGGIFAMISYDSTGSAILSKHSLLPSGEVAWSAQRGTCIETKGA